MSTKTLSKVREFLPAAFDDFFRPWNDWFEGEAPGRTLTVPAMNVTEGKEDYQVVLATPGMNKDDFSIDVDGNMLTVSASKEETKDEGKDKYTRKEYNYSSFSRCFSIPEEVNREKIDAEYKDGELHIRLPKTEQARKNNVRKVAVN